MESCNSKISELASLRTSAKRLSAPAGRRRCAPPAPRSTGRQLEHQNQRGRDRALFVPPHKSGSAVGQLIGSRTYRQWFQTAAEIVREPLHGGGRCGSFCSALITTVSRSPESVRCNFGETELGFADSVWQIAVAISWAAPVPGYGSRPVSKTYSTTPSE